jgi:hypothetical protein
MLEAVRKPEVYTACVDYPEFFGDDKTIDGATGLPAATASLTRFSASWDISGSG